MAKKPVSARVSVELSRDRFLDAAEVVFAAKGYKGASIRDIALTAEANLGTLSHYWGSKAALFKDVVLRRVGPVQAERTRRFSTLEAALDRGEVVTIAEIIEASYSPALLVPGLTDRQRQQFRKLYARLLTDPSPEVAAAMLTLFAMTNEQFRGLMRRVMPPMDDRAFRWRIGAIYGALTQMQSTAYRDAAEADDTDRVVVEWIRQMSVCLQAAVLTQP